MSKLKFKWLTITFREIFELKLWEKLILISFGSLLIISSLFDLGNFDKFEFIISNMKGNTNFQTFQNVMSLLSGITAFFGIVNVYLVAKKKISNYFWGIAGIIFYGITAFANAYTGDAILNILFFLPFNIVGLYLWRKHMNKKNEVKVIKTKLLHLALWIIFLALLWVGFWFLIPVADEGLRKFIADDSSAYQFTNKVLPHLFDSFTNAASIVASAWMIMRMKEQWVLWVIINIIQLIMWCGIGIQLSVGMIIMWTVFLINSIYGTYTWYKGGKFVVEKISNPNLEI